MKATHRGTCQCCGSVQKLPGGLLSKHGYTRKWGFFNGTCRGSGELPFEVSCDLVKQFIAMAENQICGLKDQIQVLKLYCGNLGWHRSLNPSDRGYSWAQIEITDEMLASNQFVDQFGKRCYFTTYSYYAKNVTEMAGKMNQSRITFLQREIKEIEKYIDWQNKRVQNWKPQELHPIKGV